MAVTMANGNNLETKPKLHVLLLVTDSYRTVFGNLGAMAQMLWLIIGFNIANLYLQFEEMERTWAQIHQMQQGNPALIEPMSSMVLLSIFIGGGLGLLLFAGVMVAMNRFVVLGEKPTFPGFRIGKRELRYVGYFLAVYFTQFLITIAFMIVFMLLQIGINILFGEAGAMTSILSFILFVGAGVGMAMLLLRLLFVMPAIAVDQDGGLRRRFDYAWKTAKGHTLRMFAALILGLLPWMVLNLALAELYMFPALQQVAQAGAFPFWAFSSFFLIATITGWIAMVLGVVMYAHAYRALEDIGANGAEHPVEV